ncbi:5'-3' exonuclease [Mycoplasma sp. Ms02]|uniref:5'-3' exonuclease n=1 Tax=Mycoplasma sp. Ms02 TaxID=353851 RepID=UPI001C8A35A3|nr:5'-3' exonuclease [Mycoplasma sp. Ms02]QZE12338.1 5'-3' exonuclease [Mycoplasma sp. Ms02]
MNNRFLLVDGNFLMFQSFYATYRDPENVMMSSKGVTTNGIHQFLMMLFNLVGELRPTHLFVAFDPKTKPERSKVFADYKAGRTKAPSIIFEQFDNVKKILDQLNIQHAEIDGAEADDLIATLAQNKEGQNYIYSRDKDLLQLVNSNTSVILRDSKSGSWLTTNLQNFNDKYGIQPNQIPDFKGLSGDASDNLPGVPGIGDKTAIKLLNEYKTFEGIYENIENMTPGLQKKLNTGKEMGLMCRDLAILNTDIQDVQKPLDFYATKINFEGITLIDELELYTVMQRIEKVSWLLLQDY